MFATIAVIFLKRNSICHFGKRLQALEWSLPLKEDGSIFHPLSPAETYSSKNVNFWIKMLHLTTSARRNWLHQMEFSIRLEGVGWNYDNLLSGEIRAPNIHVICSVSMVQGPHTGRIDFKRAGVVTQKHNNPPAQSTSTLRKCFLSV